MSSEPLPSATSPSRGPVIPPEFAAYLRELPQLLAEGHAGRYALLAGDEVLSIWDTQRDALQAGYERLGLEPFSVKKIDPRDPERLAAVRAAEEQACPS